MWSNISWETKPIPMYQLCNESARNDTHETYLLAKTALRRKMGRSTRG
jgi:hypothetical protein